MAGPLTHIELLALLPSLSLRGLAGDLYQLLEVDLTEMDVIVTNPGDKACAEMSLSDLMCWLKVAIL